MTREQLEAERIYWLELMQLVQTNYDARMIDICCENLDRLKKQLAA